MVFIGDSITDLKGAQESGVRFIGRVIGSEDTAFEGMDIKVIKDMSDLDRSIMEFKDCNIA